MYGSYLEFVSHPISHPKSGLYYVADFLIFIIRRNGLGAWEESHAQMGSLRVFPGRM